MNHAIIYEKCETSFILSKMLPNDVRLEHIINKFLLQNMQKQTPTACGIIDLDLLILGAVFYIWFREKAYLFAIDAGRETGILAITLIANRSLHIFERGLWFVMIVICIYYVINVSSLQFLRYVTSPTVVSVDRDYRGWTGMLPAVTLCYYDHVDAYKANEYIQNVWNVSIVDEDYFYYMDFLYAVVNATAANYVDLARFAENERFDEVNLLDLIHAIDKPFEQVLSSFDANFEIQVLPVMTERGLCYAINSPMSKILTGSKITYKDLRQPLTCQYGKQQCYIKMDLFESTGTIDVHSPLEVSATDASVISLHKSDEIIASYKVHETVASANLRALNVEQRKCVFYDEETSQLKVYSKTLCLVRCRAVMALEMCNCVPFFYPFVEGPSCSPAGFECLLDFKWPIWALHICKCPSTCAEIEYTVQTVKKSSWGIKANEDGSKSDSATSSFRWDLIPPKVRFRRDVVFGLEDLLVSFGGALALFLGFSIMSIIKLGYVLTYHTLKNFYDFFINFPKMNQQYLESRNSQTIQTIQKVNLSKPNNNFSKRSSTQPNREINSESNNVDNANLNETMSLPEFEYLN
ncbi:sodium channel protein Nach-like [Teleopsis dalmanni]|uniref:sodium channel protein Nach-like n=1 Tax=Teleopsis dalmanni TaxID=139649 RepID=UPI0018CEE7EF|nr:sodium channel protein Nach-like [Teleopsis dalmanni]